MNFIKTPVKGMPDLLPEDVRLREHVLNMIKETYKTYGFSQIATPVMEHLENLSNKQGGENEKLIFKVMKRGEDLASSLRENSSELADNGLRYDLTVPLARYYANNSSSLIAPFKSLQIGDVWRADKPQKGRFRQFTQCDIDILGDNSILAEIELISATAAMLTKIFEEVNIKKFTVHINDRRILRAMASYAGFKEEDFDLIFILLDKMDKIGINGVKEELLKNNFDSQCVEKYISMFDNVNNEVTCNEFCEFLKGEYLDPSVIENIDSILSCVKAMISSDVNLIFDPTLVRGMSYYTGTIFEISIDGYNFSIAGGGRYDKMIGKFSNEDVSACGFSIGFERIITILKDNIKNSSIIEDKKRIAILLEKGVDSVKMLDVFKKADKLRKEGNIVTVLPLKKNAKYQIQRLNDEGYNEVERVYKR